MEVWKELEEFEEEEESPKDIIEELYSGIKSYTKDLVDYRIQEVDFFPEEVTYTKPSSMSFIDPAIFGEITPKEDPHPDFGYNPKSAKNNEYLRYRLLIYPTNNMNFEFELLKFKFTVLLYPVKFYFDKTDIPDLQKFYKNDELYADNKEELIEILKTIIKSEQHQSLLRRIAAI